jgi:hypothetical protein
LLFKISKPSPAKSFFKARRTIAKSPFREFVKHQLQPISILQATGGGSRKIRTGTATLWPPVHSASSLNGEDTERRAVSMQKSEA